MDKFNNKSHSRVLVNNFNNQAFCKALNLNSISVSQLSRRLNHLPPQALHTLFHEMTLSLHSKIGVGAAIKQNGPLHIIDSSTITLSLTRYPWAKYRKSKSGIKLHLQLKFRFTSRLKDSAIVTVISENPVIPGGVIRRDCIVKLGDGKTQMQHELRLIEVLHTQGNLLSILTNDLK
jgi:hypothetical protein